MAPKLRKTPSFENWVAARIRKACRKQIKRIDDHPWHMQRHRFAFIVLGSPYPQSLTDCSTSEADENDFIEKYSKMQNMFIWARVNTSTSLVYEKMCEVTAEADADTPVLERSEHGTILLENGRPVYVTPWVAQKMIRHPLLYCNDFFDFGVLGAVYKHVFFEYHYMYYYITETEIDSCEADVLVPFMIVLPLLYDRVSNKQLFCEHFLLTNLPFLRSEGKYRDDNNPLFRETPWDYILRQLYWFVWVKYDELYRRDKFVAELSHKLFRHQAYWMFTVVTQKYPYMPEEDWEEDFRLEEYMVWLRWTMRLRTCRHRCEGCPWITDCSCPINQRYLQRTKIVPSLMEMSIRALPYRDFTKLRKASLALPSWTSSDLSLEFMLVIEPPPRHLEEVRGCQFAALWQLDSGRISRLLKCRNGGQMPLLNILQNCIYPKTSCLFCISPKEWK